MQQDFPDDLDRLSPQSRAPERGHGRLGVGAAIVLLIATLVIAVVVSAFAQPAERPVASGPGAPSTAPSTAFGSHSPEESTPPALLVHVLGAVRNPGLFEVVPGARVLDAVAQAGGLTDQADQAGINLARVLTDGEQFYVPRVGESPPAPMPGASTGQAGAPTAKVNINTGAAADLDTLPHVGPMMAQRIIDYRTANGPFSSVDDLRNVTGIGDKTFEALKDLVTT
ncbi:hypothetical protein GY21_00260 [Cryobacterium roopkundense]|uniref:Competence protein ComEA n=1 Tax=Cryobacterium roopkundense TaxID=1001240 RepID=A0A099JWI9_9MICO|nr:ComEA family DNA-binding protein [Cryobacterium roopkundense]KGJ82819.1 hypothetical protein GY21_00260 [Cryobacterium roopkundense]MBB5640912.1 competence protein ComEA [Cryobacterium roopkundense]